MITSLTMITSKSKRTVTSVYVDQVFACSAILASDVIGETLVDIHVTGSPFKARWACAVKGESGGGTRRVAMAWRGFTVVLDFFTEATGVSRHTAACEVLKVIKVIIYYYVFIM